MLRERRKKIVYTDGKNLKEQEEGARSPWTEPTQRNGGSMMRHWVVEAGAIGLSALEEVTGYCTIDSPNGGCRLDTTPHGNLPNP